MVASFTLPNVAGLGVASTSQKEQAIALARTIRNELRVSYCAELDLNPVDFSTLVSDKIYIAALDTAGTGTGTIGDPLRVGANSSGLVTALSSAISGTTSAGRAIYIDNLVDTSLASSVASAITGIDPAGPLHIYAWDRVGDDPDRIPVIDGFRPLPDWITGTITWTETSLGSGIWQTTLDAVSPLPVASRFGPAGQHVHTINLLRWAESLAEVDGRVLGEHRAHLDTGTRVLSVCLSDDQDGTAWDAGDSPSALDIRLCNVDDAFLKFSPSAGGRIFLSGMRVSGYDVIASGPIGYCIFFNCQDDVIYAGHRLRCDHADKHIIGVAGGSSGVRECLWIHWDLELGAGYSGSSGFTQDVAYNGGGGQHVIAIDTVFREPTSQNQYKNGEPTITHGAGSDTNSGSCFMLTPYVLGGESCHPRILNSRNIDPDAVYELAVGVVCRENPKFRRSVSSSSLPWSKGHAYGDFEMIIDTRNTSAFAGIQFLGAFNGDPYRCKLVIGGNFNSAAGDASNTQRYLHSRTGAATHAGSAVKYNASESVIDFRPWDHTAGAGRFMSASTAYMDDSVASGTPDFQWEGCVFYPPTNLNWTWITGESVNGTNGSAMFSVTDCVFLDTWPANQIPTAATTMTSATWAATDPSTLTAKLATAWLIDQADLLASARCLTKGIVVSDSFNVTADADAVGGVDDCVIAVTAVAAGSTPTDADYVAGIIGTIAPDTGGSVAFAGQDVDIYAVIYHEDSDLIREPQLLEAGFDDGGGSGGVASDLDGNFRLNIRPWRGFGWGTTPEPIEAGPNAPSATAGFFNSWTDPENAYALDSSYATTAAAWTDQNAQRYSGFGFAIPDGSTIVSLKFEVHHNGNASGERAFYFRPYFNGGAAPNNFVHYYVVPSSPGIIVGQGDLASFNSTALTPAFANASDFGVIVYDVNVDEDPPTTIEVDFISCTIEYY